MRRILVSLGVFVSFFGLTIRVNAQDRHIVNTAAISEQECDPNSPAFQKLENGSNPVAAMGFSQCVTLFDSDPIDVRRYVVVPTGNVNFRFFLRLVETGRASGPFDGATLHATYKITVKVSGPNGEGATNNGTVVLYGSAATDAPANAKVNGLQAPPGGTASAILDIPINVDWAESSVLYTIETSQGSGTNEPIHETCTTLADHKAGIMCSFPDWDDQYATSGPDLSSVSAGLTLPAAIPSTEFAMFVNPVAKFQLAVMPVAIVYAPLGNGKAQSSYQVSTTTGTNAQIGNTMASTTVSSLDDKTTYSGSLSISDVTKSFSAGLTLTGVWDNAEETDHQLTYGTTGQIIDSSQITVGWTIPATTTLPLTKLDYNSQPFWSDLIIVVINPQFAIWNYPGGPLIQPLGNASTYPIPLAQLVSCIATPNEIQTAQPTLANQSHFLSYASSGLTAYVWLGSDDCSNIASLDQYYVNLTQSTTPLSFRQLYTGSTYTGTALNVASSQTTQLVAGQSNSAQSTLKVTATQSTTVDASTQATETVEGALITEAVKGSWASSTSQSQSTVVTYTTQDSASLQSQTQSATNIQDSSNMSVPVTVVQDSIFQGIAVQDTNMHYTKFQHQLPLQPIKKLPPQISTISHVAWNDAVSSKRKEPMYILENPFGNVIVTNTKTHLEDIDPAERLKSDASKRHFPRPVPSAPPAIIISEPKAVLEILKSVQVPGTDLLSLRNELQTRLTPR